MADQPRHPVPSFPPPKAGVLRRSHVARGCHQTSEHEKDHLSLSTQAGQMGSFVDIKKEAAPSVPTGPSKFARAKYSFFKVVQLLTLNLRIIFMIMAIVQHSATLSQSIQRVGA